MKDKTREKLLDQIIVGIVYMVVFSVLGGVFFLGTLVNNCK